jgi:hypothetical protein
MTCEDTPHRLTWEIEQHERCSDVWICKTYGRATTTADPVDVARAALAAYLATTPPPCGEAVRVTARPDHGDPITVTPNDLPNDGYKADPEALQALPLYLRDALTGAP